MSINLYKEMLDNMYEGIYFVDNDRCIVFWNKEAEKISGFSQGEVIGKYCYSNILNHVDDYGKKLCQDGCPLHRTLKDGQKHEAEVYLHHKNGHRVFITVKTIPLLEDKKIVGAAEVFIENTKKTNNEKEISQFKNLSLHDQLTSLPNRRYIDSFLKSRMREYRELNIPFGLIMIDIDYFKKINDEYGHSFGDTVLKVISKTLKSSIRKNDLVGRWGGEEFMAVFTGITENDLKTISEKIRTLIEESSIRNKQTAISMTASLGATLATKKDSILSIQKRADAAMYMSKEKGRNMVTLL